MSKPCQWRMALSVPWVMVSWLPLCARLAWPAMISPPVGNASAASWAWAGRPKTPASSRAVPWRRRRPGLLDWPDLPWLRAVSGAGT
ncbi:hypothetical protein ACY05_00465 [Sterolibacterium denitrificans]|uniref:Uncharacterized protein n=1 Tax=Sterolibacterium denitrificans TaxID=157592 RepID=A0A656Z7P0_9PROT|nr:hypothetical protein ACY05_00465 [Sterolibacterium denitrificans]